jgi:hypothetical protein
MLQMMIPERTIITSSCSLHDPHLPEPSTVFTDDLLMIELSIASGHLLRGHPGQEMGRRAAMPQQPSSCGWFHTGGHWWRHVEVGSEAIHNRAMAGSRVRVRARARAHNWAWVEVRIRVRARIWAKVRVRVRV